eukprot:scaffold25095_cov55-Phaeocystis_antarctica.AAC.3
MPRSPWTIGRCQPGAQTVLWSGRCSHHVSRPVHAVLWHRAAPGHRDIHRWGGTLGDICHNHICAESYVCTRDAHCAMDQDLAPA